MGVAEETLSRLQRLETLAALPCVKALHLPPDPAPGATRGEFCALELADGTVGLSYVLLDDTLAQLRQADRHFGLAGRPPLEIAQQWLEPEGARKAIGLAAVNALSRWCFDRAGWAPARSADSMGALDARPEDHIGMIGLFTPLLQRVLDSGAQLTVVELKPELVAEHGRWRVTLDAQALRACNKVLATGTLLMNDSLDRMLEPCAGASSIALIGPTASCLPDALFQRGVTLMGGSWVTDGPRFLAALSAGEQRPGLSQKVSMQRGDYPGFDALLARLR
ncbi:MAG: hypothetical protein JNJ71_14835 [Rubrivivax sp.]|nr:hypothetical protein [Rubrivivax sp.]